MVLQGFIFFQAFCTAIFIFTINDMSLAKSLAGSIAKEIPEIDMDKACYNFSVLNTEKKEFYSPNYPNNYPPNLKCTLQITADFGHFVRLDFRDKFCLEDSKNCEFDHLEIRNGPYGYSPDPKKYCGSEFPEITVSNDRYLWLQFTSDETIECTGFRAVYEFVKMKDLQQRPETTECIYRRTGPSGIIYKTDIEPFRFEYSVKHKVPIDCVWVITTDPGKKIYMNFDQYKLASPNDCDSNYIELYAETRSTSKRLNQFCGTTAEPRKTESNVAHVRLFTDTKSFNGTNFTIHYTAFRDIEKNEECDLSIELNCGDNTCIDKTLRCDGHFDCKYQYDEDPAICKKASMTGMVLTSKHMITILVVFFALVIAMCASISISCYNKIKERQLREREYKERRSKEASVEGTAERSIRGHVSPDRNLESALSATKAGIQRMPTSNIFPDDGDDESSDGCYVPEMDLNDFSKHPNSAVPRVPDGRSVSRGGIQSELGKQQYPFISHSSESLQSETIIPPAPPPVPIHLKDRRDISAKKPEPVSYRFVGGKAVPDIDKTPPLERKLEPAVKQSTDSVKGTPISATPLHRNRWPPEAITEPTKPPGVYSGPGRGPSVETPKPASSDPKTAFITRGPLEAGAPRSAFTHNPSEFGLPRFGVARANPEGVRGPLGRGPDKGTPQTIYKTPESYSNNPYRPNTYRNFKTIQEDDKRNIGPSRFKAQATIESSDRDSSRPESVDSVQSAPDVVAPR